jgi:periplasmic copper chaperone A
MNRLLASLVVTALAGLAPGLVRAHVSIVSGPARADTTQEVTFGVGHGCEGADTYRVEVQIPAGVTSVRPLTSDFGAVELTPNDDGSIAMVSWQKPDEELLASDTQYYKLVVRLKAPDEPFTTLHFPTRQTCRAEDGTELTVDWVGLDESDESIEPAPALTIVPPSFPGWNRFTVPRALDELETFFGTAQIVWQGSSAYSVNPTTMELIAETDGVTPLTALAAGAQIWVKY